MKKLLVIFGILGAAGLWIFRDRLIAGVLELGGKVSQFVEDHTAGEDEDDDPMLNQVRMVQEDSQ